MNIDQIVNMKVERALGAAAIRQILLESQIEELKQRLADAESTVAQASQPSSKAHKTQDR